MFVIREEHRREYQRRAKDPPLDWAILKGCNLLNVGSIEFWKNCKTLLIFFAMIFHCLSHHNHQLVKMIIIPEIIFTRWWSFRWTQCRDDHHLVKMISRMMIILTRWQSFQWRSSRQADDHLCTAVTVNRLLSMQFSSPPNLSYSTSPLLLWSTQIYVKFRSLCHPLSPSSYNRWRKVAIPALSRPTRSQPLWVDKHVKLAMDHGQREDHHNHHRKRHIFSRRHNMPADYHHRKASYGS